MSSHVEWIKCPECEQINEAEVLHTIPFWSYVHCCDECGYYIMESEWNEINTNSIT